jgi:hypothetical protein
MNTFELPTFLRSFVKTHYSETFSIAPRKGGSGCHVYFNPELFQEWKDLERYIDDWQMPVTPVLDKP